MEFTCIKYNPIYWLLWLLVVPCMLSGKWFHACLGQGSTVREDELPFEQECRVSWIYIIDGPYLVSTITTVVRFGLAAKDGREKWDGMLLDGWSFCVTLSLIIGNCLMLHHMRRRHTGLLRCSIMLAWVEVLCLIGIQTVFGETNGPNVKQRAAQHHG